MMHKWLLSYTTVTSPLHRQGRWTVGESVGGTAAGVADIPLRCRRCGHWMKSSGTKPILGAPEF